MQDLQVGTELIRDRTGPGGGLLWPWVIFRSS